MSINVSRLRAAGLAKESTIGQFVTTPDRYLNIIPPDSFSPQIEPLPSKGIQALADMYPKVSQGPATLKGMKIKLEVEPENVGEVLNALFGQDTPAEAASFAVTSSNHSIDFKEDGGSELHATITTATYIMGTTSATASTLCKAVKDAMEAASGATGTYTVTYSYSTKKLTIAVGGAVAAVQVLWLTGLNQATGAYSLLGFSHTNTLSAASVTSDSTTHAAMFSHVFTRAQVSQLPTYTWWFDKNPLYSHLGGCMLNKADFDIKAKGLLECDTEWEGTTYESGSSKSPTFSTLKPFTFAQTVVKVDSSTVAGYDNFKLTTDNMVSADHTLTNSIYPQKIYAKGFDVQMAAELFFEDTAQYAKFLAGTTAAFQVILTSGETVGALAYSLTIDLPIVFYKAAPVFIPSNGPLKIPFSGLVQYDPSQSFTAKATLVNTVASAY